MTPAWSLSSSCCLLVNLLFIAFPTLAAAQYLIDSITGGAGCALGSSPPVNCTFPATLTVNLNSTSAAWPSTSSSCNVNFVGVQSSAYTYAYGSLSPADPTNHTVVLTLLSFGYNTGLFGAPLSAKVYCGPVASPTFTAGPTFVLVPPPVLTSTSGCALTSPTIGAVGCHLESDVVTIHGSGFSFLTGSSYNDPRRPGVTVRANNQQSEDVYIVPAPSGGVGGLAVVNDTVLLLALLGLQLPSAYFFNASVTSNLSLILGNYQTNTVTLSFAPLSGPPVVSTLVTTPYPSRPRSFIPLTGCNQTAGPSGQYIYTNCFPSVQGESNYYTSTALYIYGPNLFGAVLSLYKPTMGNIPCVADQAQINTYPYVQGCSIPAVAGNTLGMRYDLIVQTPTGTTTLPSVFSFVSQPVVTSADSCYSDGLPAGLVSYYYRKGCPPNALITVRGMNFPLNSSLVISIGYGTNVTCLSPMVVSAGVITCVLPTLNNNSDVFDWYGRNQYVSVLFVESGVLSNISATMYTFPDLPVINNVTGSCLVTSGPLALAQCRAGDTLTISGQHFFPPNGTRDTVLALVPLSPSLSAPPCYLSSYRITNDSILQCKFNRYNTYDGAANLFNVSVPYVLMTRVGPNYAQWQSNPVFISFINATAPAGNSAHSLLSLTSAHCRVSSLLVFVATLILLIS